MSSVMSTETSLVVDETTPGITRSWSCVLFDLDGTLTDSAPGITSRIARTLERLGHPPVSEDELLGWVGPPLMVALEEHGFSAEDARETLRAYRRLSEEEGPWSGSAVYPGVVGLLEGLTAAGIPIAVASSKPLYQVKQVLDHFDLSRFFTVVCGATADESVADKADIIAAGLAELELRDVDLSRAVYVGDRIYDIEGAAAHQLPSIMVEWGYGSPAEAEGAMAVVHDADRLRELLLG